MSRLNLVAIDSSEHSDRAFNCKLSYTTVLCRFIPFLLYVYLSLGAKFAYVFAKDKS